MSPLNTCVQSIGWALALCVAGCADRTGLLHEGPVADGTDAAAISDAQPVDARTDASTPPDAGAVVADAAPLPDAAIVPDAAPGPTFVGLHAGGGRRTSPRFQLEVSIAAPMPVGATGGGRFQLRVGLGVPGVSP